MYVLLTFTYKVKKKQILKNRSVIEFNHNLTG